MIDPRLQEFATEQQLKILKAIQEHGGQRHAAKALGLARGTVGNTMAALKRKAASRGYSPEHNWDNPVPETHNAARVSSHYTKGVLDQQWVIATLDEQKAQEARSAALQALAETLPRLAPVAGPVASDASLCNLFTLTDCHVGALCWHEEGGADWDLKIAEKTLVTCFEKMIAASPRAKVGIVAQLGDFLHQDGVQALTPTSGHLLDADGRFTKVVRVAVRVLRQVVDMALAKHEKVIVLMAEGNHDISSSIWLRTMFAALYENEPRIEVIDSPLPYYTYQHGDTMLAWHHGHLKKPTELPILFAAQFPKVWGNTTKRYAHCGHRHHLEEKEHSGMTVLQHPTLAARDAYAARGGWIAERQATAITYHDKGGRHSSVTVSTEMLDA